MTLFKEDNGNWSMTRLLVFIGAGATILVSLSMIVFAVVYDRDALIIGALSAFFVAAMGVFAAWKNGAKKQESSISLKTAKKEDDEPDGPDLG